MNCKEIKNIITKFIHDEVGKTGLKNVVIGLSGGLDSSVVATLAVEALGKERVIGILMPNHKYGDTSEKDSFKDAMRLAGCLGIKTFVFPVNTIINPEYLEDNVNYKHKDQLRLGNIRARARMIILYDQAMARDAIVLGTTNKTELLLGYFTKYGDGGVDIEPIADIYKTEVFKIARYIGINEKIINKPPSADLWNGQTDEEELGMEYKDVDQILWWLIEGNYNIEFLESQLEELTGIKDKYVLEKVVTLMSKNHHKTHMPNICEIGDLDIRTTMADCRKTKNA